MSQQYFARLNWQTRDEETRRAERLAQRLKRMAVSDRSRGRMPVDEDPAADTIRVLLAEDDQALRQLWATALRSQGYTVLEARDGHELRAKAYASLRGHSGAPPVDLIVADIDMPGPSGLEILAAIRRIDGAIPVILMTGFDQEDLRAEAASVGADGLLEKPFGLAELTGLARELVSVH